MNDQLGITRQTIEKTIHGPGLDLAIGVGLPTFGETQILERVGGLGAAARHVEKLGLDSVWIPDVVIGDGTPSLEATVAVAAAAAVTSRIRVGFSVLVLPPRPLALTAAQIQSLQQMSGNRVLLGIGSGAFPDTPFWHASGAPARGRGRRTDAALELLPSLIAGKSTRIAHGADQPALKLAPAVPVPPILIGGGASDVVLRRAASYGDGWFPSLIPPDGLAAGVARLRALAAEGGRPDRSVVVGVHLVPGNDSSARATRGALVRELVATHGMTEEMAASVPVWGTSEQVAERFAAYAGAGADQIVVAPTRGDWTRRCEFVAEARALVR